MPALFDNTFTRIESFSVVASQANEHRWFYMFIIAMFSLLSFLMVYGFIQKADASTTPSTSSQTQEVPALPLHQELYNPYASLGAVG